MRFSYLFAALAIVGNGLLSVIAGPGAWVNVCVDIQTKPSQKITVSFDPRSGDNKCMYSIGNPALIDVTESGVTCATVGYVEAKVSSSGGDICATDESIWNVAYATVGLPKNKSGIIKSRWRKQWFSQTNEIAFQGAPNGAVVCGSKALCDLQTFTWPTSSQGPVYFIFRPDLQRGLTDFHDLGLIAQGDN